MNLIKAITFMLCSTLLVGQTTPIRNPQIQGASGAIISGATLTNSGTFVNSGTMNGAGTFNLASGTVTLPATVGGLASWIGVNSITTLGTITTGTWNATPIGVSYGGSGETSLAASIQAYLDAISTTQGTVLYYNGTDWVALAPGTSGYYLKTQGAGANPAWAAISGTGTVTSVAVSGSDGIEIDSGSPITTSGTIALGINASTLKTHLSLNNVENTALSTWAGTTNITTLGTITTGVWDATAIAVNKIAALTADRLVITDGSGFISASSVTATQAGYLSGVTSAIQTQLDAKAGLAAPVFVGPGISSGTILLKESSILGTRTVTLAIPTFDFGEVSYTITAPTVAGSLVGTGDTGTVTNTMLANSAITISGTSTALGASITTNTILDSLSQTRGALIYRGAASWSTLAIGTSGYYLKANASGDPEWSAITLGTNTAGNYVADVAGTSNEITSTHTPGEGSTPTISLPATIDIGGKTSFEIPNAAAPTVDAFGELAGDNDVWAASRGAPVFYDGTEKTVLVNTLYSESPLDGQVPTWHTGGTITWDSHTETIIIAISDETTALTTGAGKVTFRMPFALTLTAVRASVGTAPTGSTIIVDINEGAGAGTTILSTKLSIDVSEETSTTAASAAVISDTALADDSRVTIDIDQIGSTIAGAGLKITLIGTR